MSINKIHLILVFAKLLIFWNDFVSDSSQECFFLSVKIVSDVLSWFISKLNKESIASRLWVNKLTYTDSYSFTGGHW